MTAERAATDEQMATWARALTADPAAPVYRQLAEALMTRKAPKRAALVLNAALPHHPGDVPGRVLLGEALFSTGDHHGCAREMARLLSQAPMNLDAMTLLARSLRMMGQFDEAAVIINQAHSIAPDDPRVLELFDSPTQESPLVDIAVDGSISSLDFTGEPTVLEIDESHPDFDEPTRPMPSPFEGSINVHQSEESYDEDGAEPTVQVSPSLALEAAELVAAGLLVPRSVTDSISIDVDVDGDATRPLSMVHSIDLHSVDEPEPTSPLTGRLRPGTLASAPPSMRSQMPPDDSFNEEGPTSAQPRRAPKTTTELDSRRLAGPPLDPTQELSQVALSGPPLDRTPARPAPLGPPPAVRPVPSIEVELSGPPVPIPSVGGPLDLPRFDWETPEVSEDRPSTVQLPRRRPGTSQPKVPAPASNTISSRPSARVAPIPRAQASPPPASRPAPSGRSVRPAPAARPVPPVRPASRPAPPPPVQVSRTPRPAPQAVASRPARPKPPARSPRPPAAQSKRDLLDVPLDPAEFKNMPRPAPQRGHALPDDLRTGPVAVAQRPRPAPRPKPKRAPIPPAPRPPRSARAPAAPGPPRAVERRAVPPPPRTPRRRSTEALPSTTFAARDRGPRRSFLPYLLAGLVVTIAAVTVTTLVAYRNVLRRADEVHAAALRELNAETHAGRVNATRILESAPIAANVLARLGDGVSRLFGGAGLDAPANRQKALLARVLAERAFRDAQFDLTPRIGPALQGLHADADLPDAQLARAVTALAASDLDAAQAAFDAMAPAVRDGAQARYYLAHLALFRGQRAEAAALAAQSLKLDPGYVPAELMVLEFQLERGEHDRVLAGYAELDTRANGHVGAYIERRRAWVRTLSKQAATAVSDLKKVLKNSRSDNSAVMSPTQLARLHDTIGLYYLRRDSALARAQFEKALTAQPQQVHAQIGLARLDLLSYQLPAARKRLAVVEKRYPKLPELQIEKARADLLSGDASGAVGILSALEHPNLEGLLVEAQARMALSEPPAAAAALRRARRLGAGLLDVTYYQNLADVSAKNNPAVALENLRQMTNPRVGSALWDQALPNLAYGMALMRSNRLRNAVEVLKRVRAAYPKDHRPPAALCLTHRLQLKAKAALSACRAALRINPYDLSVARLGSQIAEEYADSGAVVALLEPLKTNDPVLIRRLARAYVRRGDRARLDALVRRSGASGTNVYLESLNLILKQRPAEALAPMAKAAEALPSDEWVQLDHADLLLSQGDVQGAKRIFVAVGKSSTLPYAQLGLVRLALLNNQLKPANQAVKQAAKLARSSLSHPRVRARALALEGRIALQRLGRRGWRKARSNFYKAEKIEKELPEVLVGRGLLAQQQNKVDAALKAFGRAIQVSPRDAEAHYLFGQLLLSETDQRDRAIKVLQTAIDLDPRGRYGGLAKLALKGG